VKVGEGVFTGLEAVVTQVLSAQERVKILLEFLGRQVEAIVDTSSLV
jgi:transcription antitermination factor NusG